MLIIYGASGYTGELIARRAVAQGLHPVLGGRSAGRLVPLAQELGLDHRIFGLDDPAAIQRGVEGATVLLNASGPFKHTTAPLVAACLSQGLHYLDLAGEVPEFEALAAQDTAASAAGVMLLPGVGFGVVPTDCLAAHLKQRLPDADRLTLAFQTVGGVSHGTAETVIEDLPRGGVIRRNGELVRVAAGLHTRRIDFGDGLADAISNPWRGDISTAYHSTGIPNIEVFAVIPSPMRELMRASRYIGPLLGSGLAQRVLKRQALSQPLPSAAQRSAGRTLVWGEVTSRAGGRAAARLFGPEAYDFTALSAVAVAQRVLAGTARSGFQTPARLFGPDFVLELPGVRRDAC